MPVKYITVTAQTNLFLPATRSYGDIAIVGTVSDKAEAIKKTPVPITNPDSVSVGPQTLILSADTAAGSDTLTFASVPSSIIAGRLIGGAEGLGTGAKVASTTTTTVKMAPVTTGAMTKGTAIRFSNQHNGKAVDDIGWFEGALGDSIRTAFAQSPGPTTIWAVPIGSPAGGAANTQNVKDGLGVAAKLRVQIVVLADTPLSTGGGNKAEIEALAAHCNTVSDNGPDGMERIGVAMLEAGELDTKLITSAMASRRLNMVAHHSPDDAAAAVAGAIAGQKPHISMLLKPVNIEMTTTFSDTEIDAFNLARVNWLTQTPLIPGPGFYLGEGYTLGADQPYIDIVRTIDQISFALKAALIRSMGVLRITRSGLRALAAQMSAVLQPLEDEAVIDSYLVFFPLQTLLDKDPEKLADVELQQIHNAEVSRTVGSIVTVEYAGAIHRLNITLKFE